MLLATALLPTACSAFLLQHRTDYLPYGWHHLKWAEAPPISLTNQEKAAYVCPQACLVGATIPNEVFSSQMTLASIKLI